MPCTTRIPVSKEGENMKIKVKKRNGHMELYRKGKIIRALKEAGLESHTAKNIANSIDVKNGMTTEDIKKVVIKYLEHVDREIKEKFVETSRMKVHNDIVEVEGNCLLNSSTMEKMGFHTGEEIDVYHGEYYEKLRVFGIKGDWIKPDHLYLSHEDMKEIKAHNESRVAFRKHQAS
jgi:hypothetical protein